MKASTAATSLFALLLVAGPACAGASVVGPAIVGDTLLIERVREKDPAALPMRGQSMTQVQARFGAPSQRLDPRGGQKRQWPTINRWVYPAFTVYFEKNTVIDVVLNKASAQEIGPKPPIR